MGRDRGHLCMEDVAPGHYIGLHPRLGAQHACHVLGLRACYGGGGLIPMFGNPAAACHRLLRGVLRDYQSIPSQKKLKAQKH
jgi:hypothetical protein